MDVLYQVLPLIIYALLSILLVVLIVLGIKLIDTVNKTNAVLDDIEKKSKSLDGIFATIDSVTDAVSLISDKLVDGAAALVGKLFSLIKKKNKGVSIKCSPLLHATRSSPRRRCQSLSHRRSQSRHSRQCLSHHHLEE